MNEYTLLYYKFHCIGNMETKGIKFIGELLDHCFMQTGYVNMRVDRGRGGGRSGFIELQLLITAVCPDRQQMW